MLNNIWILIRKILSIHKYKFKKSIVLREICSEGERGKRDSLKGMSARFSLPVVVCELVTFPLTTCLAVLRAEAALNITEKLPPMFLLQAECITARREGAQPCDWVMTYTHKKTPPNTSTPRNPAGEQGVWPRRALRHRAVGFYCGGTGSNEQMMNPMWALTHS